MFDPALAFSPGFTQQTAQSLKPLISQSYALPEPDYLLRLLPLIAFSPEERLHHQELAAQLVSEVRSNKNALSLVDRLLQEYNLSVDEGVLLMSLSEALLRIPDTKTAEALIADKLTQGDWHKHLGHSKSLLVNLASLGLDLGSQ